ncbi:MAG: hypothetical protein LKJ86_05870 [Oscillibacter sp.]|jgi:hypothetical protein|nr:hypothetical protein [Oscillibacter sp.]
MENNTKKQAAKSGITLGSCLAMVISYTTWHSVAGRLCMAFSAGSM